MAGLAAKTAYSRSSWERYLNGKKLPPRQAVEALCRLAGEPLGRTVALWELADLEWSGRAARAEPAAGAARADPGPRSVATETEPPAARRRRPLARLLVGAAACGVLGFAAVAAWPTSQEGGTGTGGTARGGASAASTLPYSDAFPDPEKEARCRGAACTGQNPEAMACVSPSTVGTWRARNGEHVSIRYSKACGAGWAKIWSSRVGDRISISLVSRPAGRSGIDERSASPGGEGGGAGSGSAAVRPSQSPATSSATSPATGQAEGATQHAVVQDELDSSNYLSTPMVATNAPSDLRLCLEPAGGGAKECFGR
ncbi:DUF2690 domain-containing protein [Streptomyces varsoviensis]|uniref:helix-turn-helix domain-containing protein n=1 Tax=Streptomyces varsoviensis TaxID=67373 RepID=UPI003F4CC1F9